MEVGIETGDNILTCVTSPVDCFLSRKVVIMRAHGPIVVVHQDRAIVGLDRGNFLEQRQKPTSALDHVANGLGKKRDMTSNYRRHP